MIGAMDGANAEARVGQMIDRYRLEAVLGAGGFGAVYRARHLVMDRAVALKLLHGGLARDDGIRERFLREARTLARLQHAHVVGVHDCGVTSEGEVFLAMELLTGEDLASRLERVGRLAPASAVTLVEAALEGLAAAHDAGIVHRDLKPANVFLAREGTLERVKLVDFGISKRGEGEHLTRTGVLLGTPVYMAPESFALGTSAVDARADLYAVGVMLFEMLTGGLPYVASSYEGLVVKIATEPPPLLSAFVSVSPELVAVIERALAREPAMRFSDARAMQRALSRVPERHATAPLALAGTLVALSTLPDSPGSSGPSFATDRTMAATPLSGASAGEPQTSPAMGVVPTPSWAGAVSTPAGNPSVPAAVSMSPSAPWSRPPSVAEGAARGRLPWGWIVLALVVPTALVGVVTVFVLTYRGDTERFGTSVEVAPAVAAASTVGVPATPSVSLGSKPPVTAEPTSTAFSTAPAPVGVGGAASSNEPGPPPSSGASTSRGASVREASATGTGSWAPAVPAPDSQPGGRGVRWREPRIVGQLDPSGVHSMLEARRAQLQRCRQERDTVAYVNLMFGFGRVLLARSNPNVEGSETEAARCVANVMQRQPSLAGDNGIASIEVELAGRAP